MDLSPDDFYIEKGKLVFTELFLLKRGKCCSSGCKHCPYIKNSEVINNMVKNGKEYRTTKTNN